MSKLQQAQVANAQSQATYTLKGEMIYDNRKEIYHTIVDRISSYEKELSSGWMPR